MNILAWKIGAIKIDAKNKINSSIMYGNHIPKTKKLVESTLRKIKVCALRAQNVKCQFC
jgi:hypothetical protein